MTEALGGGLARQELVDVIQKVRARWRARLLLRGGIIIVGGGLAALALASWGLQLYKFSPASVVGFRVAIFTVFAALVALWFVRPLRRRVTRPAGRAVRRGARTVSAGGDSERG